MGQDLERQRQFTRRALVMGMGKAAALAVLAGRLYYLQVTQSERYLTLSDENRITLRLISPRRGRILDRLGRPLADNREVYQVFIVAERSQGVGLTLDALSTLIALDESDRKRVLQGHRTTAPIHSGHHTQRSQLGRGRASRGRVQ